MIVVFIIAGVVALISLYDYFNSRNWQQVTSNERNDAVFKNRNREYGAFAIRRDYDKRLMLIVGGLTAGIGVLFAATRNHDYHAKLNKPKEIVAQWVLEPNRDKPEVETEKEQKTESNPQPLAKMTAFREMTIVDTPPTDIPDIPKEGENLGGQNNPDGPDTGGTKPPLPPGPNGDPEDKGGDPEEIFIADEPAEYPGGREAMLRYLGSTIIYPQGPAELGIEGKCYIQFVVSKKGDISDVQVMRGVEDCPECDKEAVRVIKSMPLWRPGRVKGKAVNSYFNLPVKFALQ